MEEAADLGDGEEAQVVGRRRRRSGRRAVTRPPRRVVKDSFNWLE
jgi:hypothetical protein